VKSSNGSRLDDEPERATASLHDRGAGPPLVSAYAARSRVLHEASRATSAISSLAMSSSPDSTRP